MTKSKVIRALSNMRDDLNTHEVLFDDLWLSKLKDYIHTFLPNDTHKHEVIGNIYSFDITYMTVDRKAAIENSKTTLNNFIIDCIETIRVKGIERPQSNRNFISRLSNELAYTVAVGILTGGFFIGKWYSEIQNTELRTEVRILRDSVSSVTSRNSLLPNTQIVPHAKADDTTKGKLVK